MGTMAGFFIGREEGDDFTIKTGCQGGAESLDRINKLLQVRVGHVNEAFADALEVETGVVRGHHR
jgi:hypothetical protein